MNWIPVVGAADLGWACAVGTALLWAPPRVRRLLQVMLVYVLIEAAFHGPMEAGAAWIMRRWM